MTIETISRQNIKALTELTIELWNETSYDEEFKSWETVLKSTEEICFLAKKEAHYIGFLHLTLRKDYVEGAEQSPIAYVEALYVKHEFRNLGISKALLNKSEEWAKSKNVTQIASDTEITNQASIDFHKKVGFSEVNRIVCFIKNL